MDEGGERGSKIIMRHAYTHEEALWIAQSMEDNGLDVFSITFVPYAFDHVLRHCTPDGIVEARQFAILCKGKDGHGFNDTNFLSGYVNRI